MNIHGPPTGPFGCIETSMTAKNLMTIHGPPKGPSGCIKKTLSVKNLMIRIHSMNPSGPELSVLRVINLLTKNYHVSCPPLRFKYFNVLKNLKKKLLSRCCCPLLLVQRNPSADTQSILVIIFKSLWQAVAHSYAMKISPLIINQ